ncbi:MAG TPA: sigma factor-like helix-turn-helix DNA-binding protein [Terriglobales bacterium]|nr:sigma factor-like helix-turn-helix DNA-binding protein [Terriglobales bacterium]
MKYSNTRRNKAENVTRTVRATDIDLDVSPEMYLYRDRTTAMLRRYCQLSMELGRVPSLLGREFFRSRVTSYRMHNFEDVVIFVYDMERCLARLDEFSRQVLARIVLQEYSRVEAAKLLGCTLRTVERRLPEALDRLSSILLDLELLDEVNAAGAEREGHRSYSAFPPKKPVARVTACQEPDVASRAVSCT